MQSSLTGEKYPDWIKEYTQSGLYALIIGVVLFIISFFTNAVPDPSFPWATLPESLRMFAPQPRIGHWPVTYTIAIWLWVFFFPALFFKGYQKFGNSNRSGTIIWMVVLPTLAMIAWTTYCRFFWPKLYPPTWNAPAYTFICWLYCATYNTIWSNITFAIAGLGLLGNWLAWTQSKGAMVVLYAFGILALPLGLPVLVEARRQHVATSREK